MQSMIKAKEIHAKRLAEVGERLYEENLRSKLEPIHNGKIVVIDAESGDYFLGANLHEANAKARKKYPNKVFYAIKVGYPAVYSFSSRTPVSANL
jgi:hypothetical protein